MDQKIFLQDTVRDRISQEIKETKKTRPFYLSLTTDRHGMITNGIDGWMHIEEAKILWETVQHKKNCLELGTYQGLSTWIIAQANPQSQITTVEVFEEHTKKAQENCKSFYNIKYVTADSNKWLKNCNEKFDWIFVDHSHELEYMNETMKLLKKCVSHNHLVLLHDMHLPGVKHQIDNFSTFTVIRNLGIGVL